MAKWNPIETLSKKFPGYSNEEILLWNPCDGVHCYWLACNPAEKLVAENIYTHWQLAPDGPSAT